MYVNTSRKGSKNKSQNLNTIGDVYKKFVSKEYPEGHKYHLNEKDFVKMVYIFHQEVKNDILNGGIFKLPWRLGFLSITKKITHPKFRKVDWGTYHKTGEYTYFGNFHTKGYRFRVRWMRNIMISSYARNHFRFD